MDMDVLVDAALQRQFTKRAAGPLALLPLAGKALVGGAKMLGGIGSTAGNMVGHAVAMEGVNRAANKLLGPPQGGQGHGGTGAGLEPGVGGPQGPRGGATHGMLGFPQGPKGGYGPPNFGNTHSRDRADPDLKNEGADERHPVAGFKLASDVLFEMGLVKRSFGIGDVARLPGQIADFGGKELGGLTAGVGQSIMPSDVHGAGMSAGTDAAIRMAGRRIDRAGPEKAMDAGVSLAKNPHYRQAVQGHYNRAVGETLGEMPMGVGKARGTVGQGLNRAGQWMGRNPRTTMAVAAPLALYGAYRGAKALFGGGKKKEEEKPAAARIMSNNLLDILAFSMETAEKEAGFRRRPFERASLLKLAQQPGFQFSPMTPDEFKQTQAPRQYKEHPEDPDWVWDPSSHNWTHKEDLGPGPKKMIMRVPPGQGGTNSLASILKKMKPGAQAPAMPTPVEGNVLGPGATPGKTPVNPGGPPGVGKGPGDWTPPPPPGPPGVGKPGPGPSEAPPPAGGPPATPKPYLPGYDEPPGAAPATPKPYLPGYDEPPAEQAPMPKTVGTDVGSVTKPTTPVGGESMGSGTGYVPDPTPQSMGTGKGYDPSAEGTGSQIAAQGKPGGTQVGAGAGAVKPAPAAAAAGAPPPPAAPPPPVAGAPKPNIKPTGGFSVGTAK